MVETIQELISRWILHLDTSLGGVVHDYGTWTYLILFTVIFCETGLVVTPFLPGDSLLFAAGALSAKPEFNLSVTTLFFILSLAAILGDTVNYWIGAYIGPRAFSGEIRFLKKEYLDRTHRFFERHGGKAIILARFVPIIRTFAPFVAGIGSMTYAKFIAYNVIGGIAWVSLFLGAGYWFGGREIVQKNFTLVIMAIVLISVLPMVFEVVRAKLAKPKE
jgi:membrane-associated protein